MIHHVWTAAAAKSLQSYPTLCNPIDGSPPGCPVPGILQARTLEWVAISFSSAWKWKAKGIAQSCPTLRDPMDCSLPGSSVHGIFQASVLELGAIAFSLTMARTVLNTVSGNSSVLGQSCPALCYPMDCSLPGSSGHGILQARILEWLAISFSKIQQ